MLLSGGLDSTTCAAIARQDCESLTCLTFDYGQRHRRELASASAVAEFYQAELLTVSFDARAWGGSALTADLDVPKRGEIASTAIPETYVPARNTIFLSFALAVAEARECDAIYLGVNAVDYSGYPDCRPEYVEAFRVLAALALKRSVEGFPVLILTPLIDLTKADIVALGLQLQAPLELTWSCYEGGEHPCGSCDSCLLRARGFDQAGFLDPA